MICNKNALSVTGCASQGAQHEAAMDEMQEGSAANYHDQAAAVPADGGMDDLAAMMGNMHARDKGVPDAQV